jgi:prepilin-type N-terminal cleavage/methylation domain-containing protein
MRKNAPAFTLVELIVVMGLLAVAAALAVPSLSGSTRQRTLNDEAARFLSLVEYCRDEAISQGVQMTVWIDPKGQALGVEPKTGYDGVDGRTREYKTHPDVTFETDKIKKLGKTLIAVECTPDGAIISSSVESIRVVDRHNSAVTIARTLDGYGYEILKETNARRR